MMHESDAIKRLFVFHDTDTPRISTFPYTTLFRSRHRSAELKPLEVQVFGVRKSADTRAALRFFAERRIKVHFVDLLERSEEHTSELQSLAYLVCRLLLEKKKYKD